MPRQTKRFSTTDKKQQHLEWLCIAILLSLSYAGAVTTADFSENDLIGSTQLEIIYPINDSVEKLPLTVRCKVITPSLAAFTAFASEKWLCTELDRQWIRCVPTSKSYLKFEDLALGGHTIRMFLSDTSQPISKSSRYLLSQEVIFSVLSDTEFVHLHRLHTIRENNDLLQWMSKRRLQQNQDNHKEIVFADSGSTLADPDPVLVIGIKTRVFAGFPLRQAIRETWISKQTLPDDVKVFFIGCRPQFQHAQHNYEELLSAVKLEQRVYQDLLIDELECIDSYATLVDKVTKFLSFVTERTPLAHYVMIADDDVYLRIDKLTSALRKHGLRKRFYAGQVWAIQFIEKIRPVRDPIERYFLPEAVYPMNKFSPFAFGPHYIMSMDCAHFIARNHHRLRGLQGLDDVTIALWLLTLQVHPEHLPSFLNLHIAPCEDGITSFADLSPMAIRIIHSNIHEHREFCHGFHRYLWLKADS